MVIVKHKKWKMKRKRKRDREIRKVMQREEQYFIRIVMKVQNNLVFQRTQG